MEDAAKKDAILAALLPDVPFDGWTRAALRAAAVRAGFEAGEVGALFPGGARDAVAWFSRWADRLTLETVAAQPIEDKLSERVSLAVRTRLKLLAPHREAVRRGLALLAFPTNLGLGARLLYDTVDALWLAAGDASGDFSFYTKRGLLAGIYTATTLYWLDDSSPEAEATERFLARRLAHVMALPRVRRRMQERLGDVLPDPRRFVRAARRRLSRV
jgi:ubiquinone biosynthesis protein COQ9